MKRLPVFVIGVAIASQLHVSAAEDAWKEKREIWFTKPASEWKLGLPLGNGRLGAMVAGTFPKERIQLNEDSIWAKEPMLRRVWMTTECIA